MGGQPSKDRTRRLAAPRNEPQFVRISSINTWSGQINRDAATPHETCNSSPSNLLIALYDFNPAAPSDGQPTVAKDDKLRLHGYSADGDWVDVVCVRTGERVWVPANYTMTYPSSVPSSNAGNLPITFQSCNSRGTSDHGSQASLNGVGLESDKWYHGAIERSFAEFMLNSGITGSFLVRESESNPGQLTISLRFDGCIYHYRIHRDENGMYYVNESTKFHSVHDLIQHHSKHTDRLVCCLLYPVAKRVEKTNADLHLTVDLWEIDRTEIVMKHKLGSGQYGVVYEALWKTHNLCVAVKTLRDHVTVREEFLEEARLMKTLRHPNLVQLLGACTQDPPYYIITEFMCNGNLLDYLRKRTPEELTPAVLLHMAIQVARAMSYLEQHNFIHRDLAARNCLVGNQHVIKVADFGLARCIERDLTYQAHEGAKFPIKWTAPEGLVYNIFSTKSDVWAFGVLLWEIATYGKTPYPGIELQDVYVLLEKGTRMHQPEGCPPPIYKLMLQCWQWLPEQRPTFNLLRSQLEAMQSHVSIEDQVANELARTASEHSRVLDSTPVANGMRAIGNPPLPPRPPPPCRSTSFDRIVNPRSCNREYGRMSPCLSDDSQLDSGVGELPESSLIPAIRPEDPSLPNPSYWQSSTNSLGRRRPPPMPPRRTTPVKPPGLDSGLLSHSIDSQSQDSEDNFPSPPNLGDDFLISYQSNNPTVKETVTNQMSNSVIVFRPNVETNLPDAISKPARPLHPPSVNKCKKITFPPMSKIPTQSESDPNHQPSLTSPTFAKTSNNPSLFPISKKAPNRTKQPSEFDTELRQRLRQQEQLLARHMVDEQINAKKTLSSPDDSASKSACWFTLPRFRSMRSRSSKTSITSQPTVIPSDSPSSKNSTDISTHPILPRLRTTNLHSTNRSPNNLTGNSGVNRKRLSWTGPPVSRASEAPIHLALIPSVLSTSSAALAEGNEDIPITDSHHLPSRRTLVSELVSLSRKLHQLKFQSTDSSASAVEQLIAVADELEVCRLDCSNFIEQATCSARAKFGFRDRYAPLQGLSSRLRSKNSSGDNRISIIELAIKAVKDIQLELTKIPDDVDSSPTSPITDSTDTAHSPAPTTKNFTRFEFSHPTSVVRNGEFRTVVS